MLRKTKTHRNVKKKRSNSNKRKSGKVSRKTMKGGAGKVPHGQKVHEEGVRPVHGPHGPHVRPGHVKGVPYGSQGYPGHEERVYLEGVPHGQGGRQGHVHRIASNAELQKALANSLKEHQESIAKKFDPTNPFASEYVAQKKVNPLSPQEIEEIKKNYEASLSPVEAQQKAKQKAAQKEYTRLMDDFLVLKKEINNSNYTPEQKEIFLKDLQSNFFAGQSDLFSRAYHPESIPSPASAKSSIGNEPLSTRERYNLERAIQDSLATKQPITQAVSSSPLKPLLDEYEYRIGQIKEATIGQKPEYIQKALDQAFKVYQQSVKDFQAKQNLSKPRVNTSVSYAQYGQPQQEAQHRHSGATSNEEYSSQIQRAIVAGDLQKYENTQRRQKEEEAFQKAIQASLLNSQPKNLSPELQEEADYAKAIEASLKEQSPEKIIRNSLWNASEEVPQQVPAQVRSLEERFPGYKPQPISPVAAKYRADLVKEQLTTKALETEANIQRKIWEIKQLKNPSQRDTEKLFQLQRDLGSIPNLPPVGLRLDQYDPQGEALTRAWKSEKLEREFFSAAAAQNQKPPSKPSKKNFFFGRNKSSNNFA